ncbi:type II secretion system F family protein [Ornithinimicrobium pekingense]|nr:type II secretion system F family protein [Ornithinimicrobium pekingense]
MSSPLVQMAVLALLLAGGSAVWAMVPSRSVPLYRRRHGVQSVGFLGRSAEKSTAAIAGVLNRRGQSERFANKLDRAGIRQDPADFLLLVGAGIIACFAAGAVIGGIFGGVLMAFVGAVGAYFYVALKADRRKSDFADQLDDLLQLLASNLRAGHSVQQAMVSVAAELDEPGATEVTRIVNQVRVGRDLGEAVEAAAERMDSDDFRWVAQAIAIHRQVGGNLAEVLDGVSGTIRERGQIRRQVKALAAEGKMSAIILLALPFVVLLALMVLNPTYIGSLTSHVLGYILIATGAVLMTIGALWLRKAIEVKF